MKLINPRQAELMGIFAALPTNVTTHYLSKFQNGTPFMTSSDSFNVIELMRELISLAVVPRGTKAPDIKINGHNTINIRPDIIKGTATLTPLENLEIQAGQTQMILNGQLVDNGKFLDEKKLSMLKSGYMNTKARMCAELFLTGKITLPESKDVIDFKTKPAIPKTFTKGTNNWEVFFLDLLDEYVEKNKVFPTKIEVDKEILKEFLTDEKLAKQNIAYNIVDIIPQKTLEQRYPHFNILNMKIETLVPATNVVGKKIDTENMVYLSNEAEFTETYVGLEVAVNNSVLMLKADVHIDEIVEKDPPVKKYIFQSGYCPVLPITERIMKYKVTIA